MSSHLEAVLFRQHLRWSKAITLRTSARTRRFVEHASGVVAIAAILALGHLHATYITDPTSSLAAALGAASRNLEHKHGDVYAVRLFVTDAPGAACDAAPRVPAAELLATYRFGRDKGLATLSEGARRRLRPARRPNAIKMRGLGARACS